MRTSFTEKKNIWVIHNLINNFMLKYYTLLNWEKLVCYQKIDENIIVEYMDDIKFYWDDLSYNQNLSENLNSLIVEARNGTENQVEINVATRFGKVKETYKKIMPTLTYGTQNSAILNASFQTINEGRLSTVFITRSDRELETRQDDESNAIKIGSKDLPLRVLPSKVDLTTFGCPVINFAQSLFFDFGTGTTIDNLYNVTGIKHSISQGKFESGLTLQYGDIYGKFESRIVTVDSL